VTNSDDDLTVAAGYSSSAMRLMDDRGLPATPQNFALWYAYFSKRLPALNSALDGLLSSGEAIVTSALSDLYDKFLGQQQRDMALYTAGQDLSTMLDDVLSAVSQANDDAEVFNAALAKSVGSLAGLTDPKAIGRVVKALAENTQKMITQNAALQEKLEISSQEVATLKENLVDVQKEAMTDGLTGIANRKCFDLSLRREIERVAKQAAPLCLILTDIDHFKKFNDTHGHQTGDHVLRFVATMLQRSVKSVDTAARYGGEEFAVILPNTDLGAAQALAESVRAMVAGKHLRKKQTGADIGSITLSLGIAMYRNGEPIASFVKRADDALYRAKRSGRNRAIAETALDAVAD
jgi:diguanylate cyclase